METWRNTEQGEREGERKRDFAVGFRSQSNTEGTQGRN